MVMSISGRQQGQPFKSVISAFSMMSVRSSMVVMVLVLVGVYFLVIVTTSMRAGSTRKQKSSRAVWVEERSVVMVKI